MMESNGMKDDDESRKRTLNEHIDEDENASKKSKPNTTDSAEKEEELPTGGRSPRQEVKGNQEENGDTGEEEGGQTSEAAKDLLQSQKVKIDGGSETPPSQDVSVEESKGKRDERRMEINRQRAKEIRKRKKKMVEDMQKQIIYLTLENNKLRTQTQMQQAEINLLRNTNTKPPVATLGNLQFDLLAQQQQNFNLHNFQDPTHTGGASASLLAGLNRLQPTSLPPLGSNLGNAPALSQPQINGDGQSNFPFLGLQNSALGRLSNPTTNTMGVNLAGSNLNSYLGNSGDSSANNFHNQQVANVLASQQEQDANESLEMGSRINDSVASLQQDPETTHHQQISNLLANASSEMKSNLLERLQSEESEARILSMILEQQRQKQNDGPNNSQGSL